MRASARHRSTTAGDAVTRTPSASNTSALPDRLDTDRFPCFATRTPHAASTSAVQEEMLNVPDRSPPVPQVSNTLSYRLEICTARARIVFARPTISTGRSPFIARPISKPAICAAAARPSITSVIAADASSLVRSSCRVSFSIKCGNMIHQGPRVKNATLERKAPEKCNHQATKTRRDTLAFYVSSCLRGCLQQHQELLCGLSGLCVER